VLVGAQMPAHPGACPCPAAPRTPRRGMNRFKDIVGALRTDMPPLNAKSDFTELGASLHQALLEMASTLKEFF